MKKKSMIAILMAVTIMALSFSGCGERTDLADQSVIEREDKTDLAVNTTEPETVQMQTESTEETSEIQIETEIAEEGSEQDTTQTQQAVQEDTGLVTQYSEGELNARREQQKNFAEARETLYSLPNSKEKTEEINQMDRQILANNAYNLLGKNIVFRGDSITEGITSAIDQNGNPVSYVTYANSYLRFNRVLNHGLGGRMFSDYGGEELSLTANFGNVTNIDSDIIVVFAGINDYLCVAEGKRFGDVYNKESTAGYCGSVRMFMKQLQQYYGDRDIFFVMMYNTSKKSQGTCTDVEEQPTFNDYLEVQRILAKEYGFHVIELYNIGFMDCSDKESSDYYLRDGLHPKDNGNIVLGEHIAAELSLYFGQKQTN